MRVGCYLLDGFCAEKNLVIEFNGCYFHGHPDNICKLTAVKEGLKHEEQAEKYRKTLEREEYLKRFYKVKTMWYCEYLELCKEDKLLHEMSESRFPPFYAKHKSKVSEETILQAVYKNEFFGYLEVDIGVPKVWPKHFKQELSPYDYFSELSPIFCTTEVKFKDIGEEMQTYILDNNISTAPRICLVGGMRAKKILLHSSLVNWYIHHGMAVTQIYSVIEYAPSKCFKQFTDTIIKERRNAQLKKSNELRASYFKILGNSGFGSLLMNLLKHRKIRYVKGKLRTALHINNPLFQKLSVVSEKSDIYEVEMRKRKIVMNTPIQLGNTVLQYGKLRMLQFYYDFLIIFFERNSFQLLEMDTDSFYLAFNRKCIDDCVKPEKKELYMKLIYGTCKNLPLDPSIHKLFFLPRKCCKTHYNSDSSTPGIFKIEYESKEMVSLSSKCYIGSTYNVDYHTFPISIKQKRASKLIRKSLGFTPRKITSAYIRHKSCLLGYVNHKFKMSAKGLSKRSIVDPIYKFRSVLKTKRSEGGVNKGFILRKNKMVTYNQRRLGLTYLYVKRKVCADGVSTLPLDIVMEPRRRPLI